MTGGSRFDAGLLDEVRARTSLVDLIGRDVRLTRSGREMAGLCPFHHEKTPSFTVVEKKGFWHCHGCGAHGDAIGWMMQFFNLDFRSAAAALAAEAGLTAPAAGGLQALRPLDRPLDRHGAAAVSALDDERDVRRAREIWRDAAPASGTLVETYLAGRGILTRELPGGMPPSIRFATSMPYWRVVSAAGQGGGVRVNKIGAFPAMVAGIQGPGGRVSGVHITYLAADGSGKADLPPCPETGKKLPRRKVRGQKAGGSIRFSAAASRMALGDGVETVLSALMVAPDLACWSAVDLGNLAGHGENEARSGAERREAHPEKPGVWLPARAPDMTRPGLVLPDDVKEVLLLGESVNGDAHAYACLFERACRRFAAMGKIVRTVTPPHGDMNDWLMAAMAANRGG